LLKHEKFCSNCGQPIQQRDRFCTHCGHALGLQSENQQRTLLTQASIEFGAKDLSENDLSSVQNILLASISFLLTVICCVGGALLGYSQLPNILPGTALPTPHTAMVITPSLLAIPSDTLTFTPRPTLNLATVTPAPPTITLTFTPGPCIETVGDGDNLISIVARCGHRDLDVIEQVLEINNLSDPSNIQLGQSIEVPLPTETPDPNATPDETTQTSDDASAGSILIAEGLGELPTRTPSMTPTLPAGIQWHIIDEGEDIISIAYLYGADVEILSQLNPEVMFSQCDFGKATGGENCIVQLFQGQRLRVPAPTPTATIPPTSSGSETPTPTPTATYNAPSLVAPGNNVLFQRSDLITLRWSGSGTLGENELYRVFVKDLELGLERSIDTKDTLFIIPEDWQPIDTQRHRFSWYVATITNNITTDVLYQTETRQFLWESIPPATVESE